MVRSSFISAGLLLLAWTHAAAQPNPVSPEVSPDRRVTFRLKAPNAKEVKVLNDFGETLPMSKGDDGVWTVTTGPLAPDLYWYVYLMDGVGVADPRNPLVKTGVSGPESLVMVPGAPKSGVEDQLWFERDVPHGVVHEHWYKSSATGTLRNVLVYTPPGYDAAAAALYPALYLLHGLGDDARNWTMVGRAHVILDNLIAGRKAVPMVIVMPDGIVPRSAGNSDRVFEQDLMENIKPLIESQYRVSKAREDRAIAGLSMGGGQALAIGLPHLDQFAYAGSFSSGTLASGGVTRFAQFLADPAAANRQLRVFYISCGSTDNRLEGTRKFDRALNEKSIGHVFHIIPGGHAWVVFRRNLAEFAPLLFHKDPLRKEGRP